MDRNKYEKPYMILLMKRLTAYVSGKVQKVGYRARVVEIAKILGLKGLISNTDDGRVKIIAEGDDDKLRWFEDAINIKNTLIQVSSIEKDYSSAIGEFDKFYKLVEPGETDSRLDTASAHLKDLISAVDNMNSNLGGKMDLMIQKQDDLLGEVKDARKDFKGYLDQRFEKVEGEVAEIKTALKAKGII